MKKYLLYILAIPFFAIILFYVFGTNNANYEETLKKSRESRIHFLKNSSQSPFANSNNFFHDGFYDANKEFRTSGSVTINPKTQQLALAMSGGQVETYIYYGDITFDLLGKEHEIILFQNLNNNSEFLIPFGDETNGKTTYGAGRHLPVHYSGGEHIILDFNTAENPYCAYNPDYSCPLPPQKNILEIPVTAGEKSFNKH